MKKLFVEDVKVGVSKGGMACGPISGSTVAEVCVRDQKEGTVKYYSLAEVEGIPHFFETDVSTYDRQIEEVDDEGFWDMLSEHAVSDFSDYVDFFASQDEMEHNALDRLLIRKYLIYMVRAGWDDIEHLKTKSIGKCLGDFAIPVCDVEQEYLDDIADEENAVEKSETLEELIDDLSDEFAGLVIDTSSMELEEGETPEGYYSSEIQFREGQNNYKLKYSFDVNDDAEIMYVGMPNVEKLVSNEYIPCPEGEVSAERICEVLRDGMNGWLRIY